MAAETFYDAKTRPPSTRAQSDTALGTGVTSVLCRQLPRLYGARKLCKSARRAGHDVGRDRWSGASSVSAAANVSAPPSPPRPRYAIRIRRNLTANAPKQLFMTDLTFVPNWAGVSYACFIVNAHSRVIVGWLVASHMRTAMVFDTLEIARNSVVELDMPPRFRIGMHLYRHRERLAEIGAVPPISTVGDGYDNTLSETVNGY